MHRAHVPRPRLHLVTDPSLDPLELVRRVETAVPHGVDVVQLRLPGSSAREVYDLAMVLQASLLELDTRLVVNDRVDVALAVNASGIHLGAGSLPVNVARHMLGPHAPIGASVHSLGEAQNAAERGATFATFGHVYETASHPDESPKGLEELQSVVQAVDIPVVGIGGITPERVPDVLHAGAQGIAVISSILHADDVARATMELRLALDATINRRNR